MKVRSDVSLALFSLCLATLLSGCSLQTGDVVEQDAPSPAIRGHIFGGQQPVSGSTVSVYQMGTSGYGTGATLLASTMSGSDGTFQFASNAYTCPFSNTPVYILAIGGNPGSGTNSNLVLAAGLGSCSAAKNTTVNINEVTTAVTAFALSHFFTTSYGGDSTTDLFGGPAAGSGVYNVGLVAANAYTIPNLVTLASGNVNASTSTITIESAKIYSIANSLAACINSTGESSTTETSTYCGKLFADTTPSGTTRPADTLQAAVRIALYPYLHVSDIYLLAGAEPPYLGLGTAPNDWTIGVSYLSSSLGLGINGTSTSRTSSNLDIDVSGNVWFPTNTASAHGLAYFSPSTLSFNGPYATTLTHPQYLGIDRQGNVFGSDLAGASIAGVVAADPGPVTSYATSGYTGPIAAGYSGTSVDAMDFTGGGTSSGPGTTLYQELSGTISSLYTYSEPPNAIVTYAYQSMPTDSLAVDASTSGSSTVCSYETFNPDGNGTRSTTSLSPCYAGGIANTTAGEDGLSTATTANQLCDFAYGQSNVSCFNPPVALSAPEGIATDGDGFLWVANAGNASVSTFGNSNVQFNSTDYYATSPVAYLHDSNNGNTMTTPFGLAIDGSGNVWVSNAGCVSTSGSACTPGSFVLSELIGAAAPTITPLAAQNIPQTNGSRPTPIAPSLPAAKSQSRSRHPRRGGH